MAKYGMSMCVLGMAEELKSSGIGVNALWPRTIIATAAIDLIMGKESNAYARSADIMADAAYEILCQNPRECSGNFFVDELVLKKAGIVDFVPYACIRENAGQLLPDGFIDNFDNSDVGVKKPTQIDIETIRNTLQGLLNVNLVKAVNAIFVFETTYGEKWYLDLKNGSGMVGVGDPFSPPNVVIRSSTENLTNLFTGKLKPSAAFMKGKVQISGDLQKAMKLEGVMGKLSSKL